MKGQMTAPPGKGGVGPWRMMVAKRSGAREP